MGTSDSRTSRIRYVRNTSSNIPPNVVNFGAGQSNASLTLFDVTFSGPGPTVSVSLNLSLSGSFFVTDNGAALGTAVAASAVQVFGGLGGNLPAGFTANSVDGFIFNNAFIPPSTQVPELPAFSLSVSASLPWD